MVIGISEFTFGYPFLYEQTQRAWGDLRPAPILPSLRQENEQGWDAWLPTRAADFYFQFKMAEHTARNTARFSNFRLPHYRIALYHRDRNQQHRALFDHAQRNPYTYHVAPQLQSRSTFNQAFLANRITDQSRIIPATEIGDILPPADQERHYIIYAPGLDPEFHSDESRRLQPYPGSEMGELYTASRTKWRPVSADFADQILAQANESIARLGEGILDPAEREMVDEARRLSQKPDTRGTGATLALAAKALAVAPGVTLVLVGQRETEPT